jgi:hypothetical protein
MSDEDDGDVNIAVLRLSLLNAVLIRSWKQASSQTIRLAMVNSIERRRLDGITTMATTVTNTVKENLFRWGCSNNLLF